jgi:hypothetical protein
MNGATEMDVNGKTRVNLLIWANDENEKVVCHTHHIGFFDAAVVPWMVDGLDIRGLAYHSDVPGQIGKVTLVRALMIGDTGEDRGLRWESHEPPHGRTSERFLKFMGRVRHV